MCSYIIRMRVQLIGLHVFQSSQFRLLQHYNQKGELHQEPALYFLMFINQQYLVDVEQLVAICGQYKH